MRLFHSSTILLLLLSLTLAIASKPMNGQEPSLAWNAIQYFQYNIENISVDRTTTPYKVRIIFSITDPTGTQTAQPGVVTSNGQTFWNLKSSPPFTALPAPSRVFVDVGWNTIDFVNTGSANAALNPLTPQGTGKGAALPIQINALTAAAISCTSTASSCPEISVPMGRYYVTTSLPPQAIGTGRAVIEGHPAWPLSDTDPTLVAVPVKTAYRDFAITDASAVPRRTIVDFDSRCQACHTGSYHDETYIPRLALHGGNRNEEPQACVVCHNPNQTDIPYRTSGQEESVDFKRMVHGIHAGEKRENALIIVGFGGTITDFSGVRFPAELRNCLNCHVEINGKGTFELPLRTQMGSSINTQSIYNTYVDVDPTNDLKITPTAATCSACHDKSEVRWHMVTRGGASFSALQSDIDSGRIRERCVKCHGPGAIEDVRRVHLGSDD